MHDVTERPGPLATTPLAHVGTIDGTTSTIRTAHYSGIGVIMLVVTGETVYADAT